MPDQDIAQIERASEHMERRLNLACDQRDNASDAGYALARTVARYFDSPQEVGRAALREAYSAFMARHASNFSS